MNVAVLSDRALAIVKFVERRGGRVGCDALFAEFVCRRRNWWPEDLYAAQAETLEAGALDFDGERLRVPS